MVIASDKQKVYIFINSKSIINIECLLQFLYIYLNCKFGLNVDVIPKKIEVSTDMDDIIYNGLSIFDNYNNESPSDWLLYYGSGNLPSCDMVDVFLFNDNIKTKKCLYVINKTHSDISYENHKNDILQNIKRLRTNLDYMFEKKYYLNYHKLFYSE